MIFGKLVDGQIVEAPQEFTSDKGKYIKDFPNYLGMMYKNRFLDRMYGYTDIEELTKVTNEDKIKKIEEENAQLKSQQQTQDMFIDATMMATDEIYTMLEPLLGVTQTMSVLNDDIKEVSKMVEFYAAMVIRGLKDINEVPLRYREDVKKLLTELEK